MITGGDTRFKHLERKVGIFVLAAMLGVVGVVVFIAKESDMLTSTYSVRLTAPKGTGFSQGMPIKLSGFRIGRVKSITLNDSAAVDVVLSIDSKYKKWLRKDSVARLIKEGMIGDFIIEVTSGTSQELIPENGVITLGSSMAFEDIANELAAKVTPVLMDIRDIISYINREDGDIKVGIRNLRELSGNLEQSRQHADFLLVSGKNTVESTGKKLDSILAITGTRLEQVEPVLLKADKSLTSVEKSLPPLLEKLDASLINIGQLSRELNNTSAEALPQIPRLINKAEGVIDQSEDLLEGMKWIWPLSTVVVPSEHNPLVRRDSHE
jgi:phospholipid/cholesterol/gamma-HCH transport system substrate-binding protein